MSSERKAICFKPPEGFAVESLVPGETMPVKLQNASYRKVRRTYYDTFEWQFFARDIALVREGRRLSLISLSTGLEETSVRFQASPRSILPSALPEGECRNEIARIADIRAIIKRCDIQAEVVSYRILDEEEKTIGFLCRETCSLITGKAGRNKITESVTITPLKGFHEEVETFASQIAAALGRERETRYRDLFMQFMAAAGVTVNDYTSKIRIVLEPDDPVQKSAAALLLATLDIMKRNEPWIPENIDTEFLHDYRVAVRRTRSVLGTVRNMFDSETIDRYRNAFRNVGKACNALRDCDVYLLRESEYRAMLPDSLVGHIGSFFEELHDLHAVELRRFSAFLRSDFYRSMLQDWESLLKETWRNPVPAAGENPETPSTISMAGKNIRKAWKKLLRHGRAISTEATDAELHSLRIDCKKLRYLLELFASLYPEKTLAQVVRQLKELQENLGMFVDLAVQQRYLTEYLERMKEKPSDPKLAAALGGLVTTLNYRQEKTRQLFHRTFRHFDNDETESLFNALLNS